MSLKQNSDLKGQIQNLVGLRKASSAFDPLDLGAVWSHSGQRAASRVFEIANMLVFGVCVCVEGGGTYTVHTEKSRT